MQTIVDNVEAVLSLTPERWQRLIQGLPLELLTHPPAAEEWSALNCLQHLLVAERYLFPVRVSELRAGQSFSAFNPRQPQEEINALSPEQLAGAFTDARQKSLILLRNITEGELERSTQHPTLGTVNLSQLLHTWAAHDLMHTVQAERALMQPFMLGCGSWRSFFQDHEVKIAEA